MIQTVVRGDSEVMARLQRFNARLQPEMVVGMQRVTIQLQTKVKSEKLSGQVLKVKTGRLRNSVMNDVQESGSTVTGIVSSAVVYAAAHEYGFHETVDVREHMRTVKQAFGRPIDPVDVTVRAHSMKMNLPERSFLRSSLEEMSESGLIVDEMQAAVERAQAAS